jgi:hypothetical protein
VRARQELGADRRHGFLFERRSPPLATADRIDHDVRQVELGNRAATASTMAAVAASRLDGVGSDIARDRSICAVTRSVSTARHIETPRVFCAVIAVIAEVPKTRCAAKVFRSA